MYKFVIATSNKHKILEFNYIFNQFNIHIEGLPNSLKILPPEENGKTFSENSGLKAKYYSNHIDLPVLADDSGLCVESLNNAPGIYSSRFAGPYAKDFDNNDKLLKLMEKFENPKSRKAKFVCSLTLAYKGKILKQFLGSVNGFILTKASGTHGFGYDPLFYFEPLKKTFSEIEDVDKNKISHRFKASTKFANWLIKSKIQFQVSH